MTATTPTRPTSKPSSRCCQLEEVDEAVQRTDVLEGKLRRAGADPAAHLRKQRHSKTSPRFDDEADPTEAGLGNQKAHEGQGFLLEPTRTQVTDDPHHREPLVVGAEGR